MSLRDKTVLITGAGRANGIGAGIARCFAEAGASIIITDLDGTPIAETVTSLPGNVTGLYADAGSQASMGELATRLQDEYGGVDVLVNNAGIGGPTMMFDEAGENDSALVMTDEAWDEQLAANLRTTFSSTRAISGIIRSGGSIVNIASIAALGPTQQLPAYGAAKAGVVHFTRTMSMSLAPDVRVNCICPGLLWTRAWEILGEQMKRRNPEFANMNARQVFETIVAGAVPLAGEQTPEDIGNLAVFYASDKARMITGQVVAVDGGMSVS